jgi:hypothetical protein
MRFAELDEYDVVINIIIADGLPELEVDEDGNPIGELPNWVDAPDEVGIGWTWDGTTFHPPEPEPEPDPVISHDPIIVALVHAFVNTQNLEDPPPWTQPAGAHDAYLPGAIVYHDNTTWRNDLLILNVWEPGTLNSGWTDLNPRPPEETPDWRQPTGAHDAYRIGDRVKHNNQTWVSIVDYNIWEPGVYGWELE